MDQKFEKEKHHQLCLPFHPELTSNYAAMIRLQGGNFCLGKVYMSGARCHFKATSNVD